MSATLEAERHVVSVLQALVGVPCADAATSTGAVLGLARWIALALEWNAKLDLTSAGNTRDMAELFVADAAVVASRSKDDASATIVDVGAGAGAPGLALALLGAGRVTLVDANAKRVAFLRTVVGTLDVDVCIARSRSESLAGGSFDVAISRATMPPPAWLAEGARLATKRVWVLLAREPRPSLAGWHVVDEVTYALPFSGNERRAVAYAPAVEAPSPAPER